MYINRHSFFLSFRKYGCSFCAFVILYREYSCLFFYFPEGCYMESICTSQIKILEVKMNKVVSGIWNNKLILLWFLIILEKYSGILFPMRFLLLFSSVYPVLSIILVVFDIFVSIYFDIYIYM